MTDRVYGSDDSALVIYITRVDRRHHQQLSIGIL